MIKKILRELFLLPRGEQRALILLSMLLILSIGVRMAVQLLPSRPPPGMEHFILESHALIAAMEGKDNLNNSAFTKKSLPKPKDTFGRSQVRVNQTPIPVNSADSVQLLPLPGIGPVYAGRIIRYRELLGGYVQIDQLNEVYGLEEETIEMITDLIIIDQSMIRKIKLDSATFTQLLRHPYLQYEDVKSLVSFREFKSGIDSIQELRANHLLSDSTLEKIGPYLHFGN